MNADNVVKTGNAVFAAGCGLSVLFWFVLPALFMAFALIYGILAS